MDEVRNTNGGLSLVSFIWYAIVLSITFGRGFLGIAVQCLVVTAHHQQWLLVQNPILNIFSSYPLEEKVSVCCLGHVIWQLWDSWVWLVVSSPLHIDCFASISCCWLHHSTRCFGLQPDDNVNKVAWASRMNGTCTPNIVGNLLSQNVLHMRSTG